MGGQRGAPAPPEGEDDLQEAEDVDDDHVSHLMLAQVGEERPIGGHEYERRGQAGRARAEA